MIRRFHICSKLFWNLWVQGMSWGKGVESANNDTRKWPIIPFDVVWYPWPLWFFCLISNKKIRGVTGTWLHSMYLCNGSEYIAKGDNRFHNLVTLLIEWILRECQQSWALGLRQHFNTQNRHGPNPEYNCVILVFVTPRMSTRLVKSMK
jgi:hypothetical protein